MSKFIDPDKETLEMLAKIRKKHYPAFRKAKIITIMRNGRWSKYGTIHIVTEEQKKTGIAADYILTLSNDAWKIFTAKQRRALIDHELAHIVRKETNKGIKWKLRHHDIEEFNAIVQRYGEWLPSVTKFRKALEASK